MQNDPIVSKSSELLRLGLMPSPEELRAGKVSYFGPDIIYRGDSADLCSVSVTL